MRGLSGFLRPPLNLKDKAGHIKKTRVHPRSRTNAPTNHKTFLEQNVLWQQEFGVVAGSRVVSPARIGVGAWVC